MPNLLNRKTTPDDCWYRTQAVKCYHDEGFIEIDEYAPVSQADGNSGNGAYVQAWVWIADPEAQDVKEPQEPNDCGDQGSFP
jgi:hypothetical protein